MDEKSRPRSPAERIRTLAQAALNADETVDQMDHILDDLEQNLVGLNKAVGTMESSLQYFNQTLHRLNENLEQLEGMMGRVQRLVDVAESAMSPVVATESAVRGVFNAIRRK
jgi:ABC-type transporter Mla subunit MlaD